MPWMYDQDVYEDSSEVLDYIFTDFEVDDYEIESYLENFDTGALIRMIRDQTDWEDLRKELTDSEYNDAYYAIKEGEDFEWAGCEFIWFEEYKEEGEEEEEE